MTDGKRRNGSHHPARPRHHDTDAESILDSNPGLNPGSRASESEIRYQAILDSVADAVITIDDRGVIEVANAATESIFGYSQDELIGQNIAILMPGEHRDKHDGYIADYMATGRHAIIGVGRELNAVRKDGEIFPIDLTVTPVRLADRMLFTGIIRDITRRKELEEQREQLIAELREAITQVKLLTGHIPICACCKKVRTEEGEWVVIEKYFQDKIDLSFSHGICEPCRDHLYGSTLKKNGS